MRGRLEVLRLTAERAREAGIAVAADHDHDPWPAINRAAPDAFMRFSELGHPGGIPEAAPVPEPDPGTFVNCG